MGKNLVVQLNDLEGSECTLILFNGQHWRIRNGKAYRYSVMYIDGKPQEVTFDVSMIQKLYANIQQVKDERQRVIANRLNPNCRLLTLANRKIKKKI